MPTSFSKPSLKEKSVVYPKDRTNEQTRRSVSGGPYAHMLALQQTIGNRAFSRLLQASDGTMPNSEIQSDVETNYPNQLSLPLQTADPPGQLLRRAGDEF